MPYCWTPSSPTEPERLALWPHRSLGARGFVAFIAATAALSAVPLLALLGTSALWVVLVFALAALAAVWAALRRNSRDLTLTEVLTLTRDQVRLVRRAPDGREQVWTANPHWVRVSLYATQGPVPDYLTLTGGGREVELGAFLSAEERTALAVELGDLLAALR